MKLSDSQLFSSTIHPESIHNGFERKTQAGSQLAESTFSQDCKLGYETKSDIKSVTDQLYNSHPQNTKWYIVVGLLTIWLLVSTALNIYLGIKANQHQEKDLTYHKSQISYFENCNDFIYEINLPNISGKRVSLNVAHLPDCYISQNFPRTGDGPDDNDFPADQLPPPPNSDPKQQPPLLDNHTAPNTQTDNLIYIQEHKISVMAFVQDSN